MGSDIHLFAEKRNPINNMWEIIPAYQLVKCWRCDGKSTTICHVCNNQPKYTGFRLHVGRNLTLFSILADIKNPGFTYISKPIGFPDNASDMLNYEHDMWMENGHNFSYLTAEMALDFDWDQFIEETGLIQAEEYVKWQERGYKGRPEDYYDWLPSSKQTVVEICNKKMEDLVKTHKPKSNELKKYVTRINWNTTYKEMCENFLEIVNSACRYTNPKDVRFIFWFEG